jgi:hypothetical protein
LSSEHRRAWRSRESAAHIGRGQHLVEDAVGQAELRIDAAFGGLVARACRGSGRWRTASSVPSANAFADVRLSNDFPGARYVSVYTLATGIAYTDATLPECSRARGRQNEPAVAVDPRNTNVLVGSANDYCGVYNNGNDADGAPIPAGPIWLGYYRSQNGGVSFRSSLIPTR